MHRVPSRNELDPLAGGMELGGERRPVVLHVAQPGSEGVAHYVVDMSRELAADFAVAVAGPTDSVLSAGLSPLPVSFHPWNASRNPFEGLVADARRLDRIIRTVRPDLVHLHSSKAGAVGRLVVRRRLPTVLQPHAWSFQSVGAPMAATALAWERMAARWTHALIAVSDAERDLAIRSGLRGFEHIEVIINPVDTRRFRPGPAQSSSRSGVTPAGEVAGNGAGHRPVVACVGRLCRQKGQDVLLASVWPRVRARVPDAVLILVGDGPDRTKLESMADESVRLLGNRSDVDELLRRVDLAVFPSRWEGMSLAMLEAMASGVSVVASDVGGVAETVARGAGAVVPLDEHEAWADAIAARLQRPAMRTAEGERGRQIVTAAHSPGAVAARLATVYHRLVGAADRAESIKSFNRAVRL